jgi:RNA polymerase sigma-70 factor (ECF subfamily)
VSSIPVGSTGESESAGAESDVILRAALHGVRRGDEESFAILYRHHNSRLTRFLQARLVGSGVDADEVASETWMSVARDVRKFEGGPTEFRSWLYAIARNRMMDAIRLRDKQVRPTEDLEEAFWLPSSANVEREIEASESVQRVMNEIAKLPLGQGEVILLRVVSDLSVEETAKVLGKTANTVRVLAHRGMKTLQEALGGENHNV